MDDDRPTCVGCGRRIESTEIRVVEKRTIVRCAFCPTSKPQKPFRLSENDRRFLRSNRIKPEE